MAWKRVRVLVQASTMEGWEKAVSLTRELNAVREYTAHREQDINSTRYDKTRDCMKGSRRRLQLEVTRELAECEGLAGPPLKDMIANG